MNTAEIPGFVKKVRRSFNLTQERFAQKVGVSFATINSWENNKRKPQPFLMDKLIVLEKQRHKKQRVGK